MLKFFRNNIKAIIWIIVLSFVAWGGGTLSVSRDDRSTYAGVIGKEKIQYQEFLMTFRFYDLLARAQDAQTDAEDQKSEAVSDEAETGSEAEAVQEETSEASEAPVNETEEAPEPKEPTSLDQIRSLTWQTLLLSREAKKEKIAVSDDEVRAEVRRLFQFEESFDPAFYDRWVQNNFRARPRDFEEVVRHHLAAQKLREHHLAGVPEDERNGRWLGQLVTMMSRANIQDYTAEQ